MSKSSSSRYTCAVSRAHTCVGSGPNAPIGTTSRCSEKVAGWYERIARAGEEQGLDGIRRAIYGERSRREIRGAARVADLLVFADVDTLFVSSLPLLKSAQNPL